MAEAAVNHVLRKLSNAMVDIAQELYKVSEVSGQIEQMQTELHLIQALLRDADSKSNRDQRVREWLNLVREIANRIEDVIDTFLVEIKENSPKSCCWFPKPSCLDCNKLMTVVRNPIKMNKLSGELNQITQELRLIYQRRTDLGITVLGARSEENDQPFRPTKLSDIDESEVVGLDAATCEIIKQLLDKNESRRMVLSIVGPGGIGKTTLAQNVYKSAELVGQFDCCIWLSISQKFNINDLLREIFYSIEPGMRKQNPPVTDEEVLAKLKSSLGPKRYLIILDDVWTIELWDRLKIQLPDLNNASRVIITTRLGNVAKRADCNTKPYMLGYLNDDASLALLFRMAFQKHIEPEKYPHNLLGVAKKLMKKCDGLPLALVVLGGILTTEERTYSAWSKLEETMDWHKDEKCSRVLDMSYKHLPSDLKPCFLYFASFPEDYRISAKHVTRMWVAEGFIPKDGSGTMEDKAERFLQELVQRCLIQVTEKSWNGFSKYCRIHDLLRDLAIRKAKQDNFFTIFPKEKDVNQLATRKLHRAALQFCTLTKDGIDSKNTRSLLCFSVEKSSTNGSGFRLLNFSGFRLLRVLTIERVDTRDFAGSDWLTGLVHLRYLGLRYCTIRQELFKNISLNNLETVDLKGSDIFGDKEEATDWSSDVVIPNLRHLFGDSDAVLCFPLKWDHHTNLQTLKYVNNGALPKLGCCINLRTLGIYYPDGRVVRHPEEWQTLKSVLTRTEQLASLTILAGDYIIPFGGTRDLPCHEKIQSLHLEVEWAKDMWLPSVEMFPTNLTKLVLQYSRLEEDPMPILENLQSLRTLRLLYYSYMGTKLICSTGGFANLEKLELVGLPKLSHWDIKEGAMPILCHLKISHCYELRTLPELPKVQINREIDDKIALQFINHFCLQLQRKRDISPLRTEMNG